MPEGNPHTSRHSFNCNSMICGGKPSCGRRATGSHKTISWTASKTACGLRPPGRQKERTRVDRPAACLLYVRLIVDGEKDALRSLAKLKKEMDAKEWKKVEKQLPGFRIEPKKLDAALQRVDPH